MVKEKVLIILLVLISLPVSYYLYKKHLEKYKVSPTKNEYSIMMDVGSSSTKVYTYTYPKKTDDSLINIEEKGYFKKKGGIDDKTELSSYFSELFDDSKYKIMNLSNFSADLSEVPLFVKGTAGLRKLSTSNQETVISGIRKVIKNESPFLFQNEWAKIINGTEEAFSSWITINYITGVLKKNDDARKQIIQTEGSLDMGGSSFEISYVPNGEIKQNKFNIDLGHLSYDLFPFCLEGYGQDDSLEKLNDYLVNKAESTKTKIDNPCYLQGYEEKYTKDEKKTLVGTGNVEECEKTINDSLISNILKENPYFPDKTGVKFIAFNAYAYTASSIGVTLNEYIYPTEFYDKGKIYCSKQFTKIKEENPSTEDEYLKCYCFTSMYYYHLMSDVFKLNLKEKTIKVAETINGITPSWALGAMTYEIGLLPFS